MEIFMGSDSKPIERGSHNLFKANLCVVIKTENIQEFNQFMIYY